MVIFIVVPLGMVAYFAFTNLDGKFSIANIVEVANYSSVIIRSLWMALVATVISLLLGYPFAYFMARRTVHVRRTMLMLITLPMWMNFLVHVRHDADADHAADVDELSAPHLRVDDDSRK